MSAGFGVPPTKWPNMPDNDRCGVCKFRQSVPCGRPGDHQTTLECHRYPPPHPEVFSELGWCGEFKRGAGGKP